MAKQINILKKWYLPVLVILLGLNSFCKFVVQELSESKSDIHFFTIRERSWVRDFERVASPIFDSSCSPKGALAYNYIFDMQEENPIVNVSQYATFTQLQQLLVNNHFNLENDYDFFMLFYETLPFSSSAEHAFLAVNQLRYNRHKTYRFKSYQSFVNYKNALL